MKNGTENNQDEATNASAVRDCLPRLVRLGKPSGGTPPQSVKEFSLKVGDTIRGKELRIGGGWHEARLTLIWVGEELCVWRYQWRNSNNEDRWYDEGESANWTLMYREWFLESNPPVLTPKQD
jgi:hypothetical protein